MNDLYSLLMRREAELVMRIEKFEQQGNFKAADDAREYKEIVSNRRLSMKAYIKEIA